MSRDAGHVAIRVRDDSILVQYNMGVGAIEKRTTDRSEKLARHIMPSATPSEWSRAARQLDDIQRRRHDMLTVADALLGEGQWSASHSGRVVSLHGGLVHGFLAMVEGETQEVDARPEALREVMLKQRVDSLFLSDLLGCVHVEDERTERAPKRARVA